MRELMHWRSISIVLVVFVFCNILIGSNNLGKEPLEDSIEDHQRVLVINSYHQGFSWTDDQTEAIIQSFAEESENTVVSVEYLDWKRYPYTENLRQQLHYLEYKYASQMIDVVITTDDMAMKFAIDHRESLFPEADIVFTAVFEDSAKTHMEGFEGITGVYEGIDVEGTLSVMLEIHSDLKHLYVISDRSESSIELTSQVAFVMERLDASVDIEVLDFYTYDGIIGKLSVAEDDSAAFFGSFTVDALGDSIPAEMFAEALATNTDVPIYTSYDFFLGHGVVGGSLLSGELQGKTGAELAIRILNGESADDIPIVDEKTVFYGYDYKLLNEHNIFPNQLPQEHQLVNKPESIYEEYKNVIITFMGVLIFMVSFIAILVININLRRHAQKALEDEHNEVLSTYRALADSEELLRNQNEELMEQQDRINYLAYNDHLTDLPNRLQIKNYSSLLIEQSQIHHSKMMLVFIDLDNFNYVNTAHGHMVGDIMLKQLAKRFKAYLDGQGIIGRIGGDEFVCLKGIEEGYDIDGFIQGLMETFEQPISIKHREVHATASMGYALYPEDGDCYDELLIRADMAMYKMKDSGKSQASRFDVQMNEEMTNKISLTNAMKKALENEEFHLVYQPQYNVKENVVVGYEALLRWTSSTLGNVGPNQFIPISESTGDIVEVGYYVIEEAIAFARRLMDENEKTKVSVNISVVQLLRFDFVERVKALLDVYKVDAEMIEFEITESVLIESFEVVNQQLMAIQDIGIQIALDDFGTGYSSLTYLKKLPISTLKIDKTFIDDITIEGDGHFFTGTIIDIAKQLGFRVVAEGVEEVEQVDYLKSKGCHIIQGYWFSKPIKAENAIELHKNVNELVMS